MPVEINLEHRQNASMIRVTPKALNVSLRGLTVYLDNWAFIELAEGDPARRRRFTETVHSGIDLLFSATNAAELTGPQGSSSDSIRAFVDEIGSYWYPVRLDATEAVKLELKGESPQTVCTDQDFFEYCITDRIRSNTAEGAQVIAVCDDLFRLGPVLERLASQRETIRQTSLEFDSVIKERMTRFRERGKRDPGFLDRSLPARPFNPERRASFVYLNLLRLMAIESNSLKKGDGMDFCHAVMACAFSNFAALDTHWTRRIKALPSNPLARVYSPHELDQMVADMESSLTAHAA